MNRNEKLLRMDDNSLFRRDVMEKMIVKYGISGINAGNLVRRSSFNYMLKRDPAFVMHHSADYWAGKVMEESQM